MTQPATEEQIGSAPCERCASCNSTGEFIHREQRDRLFGAVGSWNFKKCSNPQCGLIWLDPMPLTEDLWKAYRQYYTHASRSGNGEAGRLKRMFELVKRGYWEGKYNYPTANGSLLLRALGILLYLAPLRRTRVDAEVRLLDAVPQGRLLDVGCGAGEWLVSMRDLGWQAEGLDFDEAAVKVARQKGLTVGCGSLEQQNFPDASFDAVTLNHVIEHVPDPVATLKECARILKPGGKVVIFTPNGASLGHRYFGPDWRGLEVPRHLHIFSLGSLRRVLDQSGFQKVQVRPQIVWTVIYESMLLRGRKPGMTSPLQYTWQAKAFGRWFGLAELLVVKFSPSVADCAIAIGVKPRS